jgi:hypothetical protein
MDSGTLAGSTNAVLGGPGLIGWYGASMAGVLTLASGSTLSITSGNDHNIYSCIFTNNGTVVWTGGRVRGGGNPGTTIQNNGLWNVQLDNVINNDGGGAGTTFNNAGTFSKSVTTGDTVLYGGVFFNQTGGSCDVQGGRVLLQSGGSFTGGTATNTGTLVLNGGGFLINGTLTTTNVQINGGTLAAGNSMINGGLNWVGGVWNNGGPMSIATNSLLLITSGNDHDLYNCALTNNGTVAWSAGRIRGGANPSGTQIYNYGLFDVQNDGYTINNDGGGVGTTINNYGTFRKSVGTNTSNTAIYGGVLFNQLAGVLDTQNGVLVLASGGNFTGGFTTTNGTGTTYLNAGGFNINGTVTSSNVVENAGNLVGTNIIRGALQWQAGTWDNAGAVTLTAGSTLFINNTADHDLYNCGFTNHGSVIWTAGRIRGGADPYGTQIYNYGLFDVQNDGYSVQDDGGGSEGTTIDNYGTFRKSVGTNTSNTLVNGGVVFNQLAGVLDTQNGVLLLAGGGSFTGGYTTTNGTGITYLNVGGFNVNGTVTSSNVVENAGNLVGTNIIRGALQWQAGNWDSAGPVTVTAGSTLYINNTPDHDLANCIFTNNGIVIWTSGRIRGGGNPSGTQIYNNGLFDVQNDGYGINNDFGGVGTTLNNFGTFRKSVGNNANNTPIYGGVLFNQLSGLLDVQSGNLSLQSSGNLTGGQATNTVGMLILNGGGFFINGTITSTNVQINGGTLAAGNNVVNGGLNWVVGIWNNAGAMTIAPGSLLLVTSASDHDLANCTLTNNGTVMWLAGRIRGGGTPGTPIYNNGLFDVQCDSSLNDDFGGTGTTFNNAGTVRKELTTGNTILTGGVFYNHTGNLDVRSGAVYLQGSGTFTGGTATNTGAIILNSGSFLINGTATTTKVSLNGGTLAAGNSVINGGLNWVVGDWNSGGPMTITPGSLLLVTSGNDHNLANCTLTNNGTVMWLAGRLRGGGTPGTPIYNNGLFDVQCDSSINDDFGGTGTTFNNAGTVRKELTSGVTAFTGGVAFNNTGTMDLQDGNLALQGAYNLANGTKMSFGLGGWLGNGSISLPGPAAFSGSVSVNMNGYFYPGVGNSFNLLNYTSETGVLFTNTVLPPPFTWQSNYNATAYAITVVGRPAITNTASTNLNSRVVNETTLYLAWPGDHTGWSLQAQTNSLSVGLKPTWTTVAGSSVTNEFFMPINKTNSTVFFRMIYP